MTRREWLAALGGAAATWSRPRAQPATPVSGDPTTWSLATLIDAYAAGRTTPLDVTAAYLARIDAENGALHAYVTVSRERAVAETRRLLAGRSAAAARGPLHGVPVAHKDLFKTRGVRTAGGSRLYEHDVPDVDAAVVAACTSAGAVMLGKTNTHELGGGVTTINPFFGTTHNPHDLTRIPGGSSGGSAVAVAARLALIATGSDTGGSVRIPAALCGCVGFKPTFGLLSTDGLLGACPTFDHAGLLTRTAEDAAVALSALMASAPGPGGSAPFLDAYRAAVGRGLRGVRVGVAREHAFEGIDAVVDNAVARLLERLRGDGARVHDVTFPGGHRLYESMFAPLAASEIRATYGRAFRARPEAFSNDFASLFDGAGPDVAALTAAREARDVTERSVDATLRDVDVVVTPTVPVVAPRIDGPIDGMRLLQNTWVMNAARVPAVSVPCGAGDDLPVGLQLVARAGAEARLLAVASLVERLAPGSGQ